MMQYDVVAKLLLEIGRDSILRSFLGIEAEGAELILDVPPETVSTRSADFALRLRAGGSERIVLLEMQTRWEPEKPRVMVEYRARFQTKYPGVEVDPFMVLFQADARAVDVYRDKYLTFRFHLVKLWELEAARHLESGVGILPFIPLMRGGLETTLEAERRIYAAPMPPVVRADLLTALAVLTGLQDRQLAKELLGRRRDIMIESPVYDMIKDEGKLEGKIEGKLEGKREGQIEGKREGKIEVAAAMVGEGTPLATVLRLTGLTEGDLRAGGLIA